MIADLHPRPTEVARDEAAFEIDDLVVAYGRRIVLRGLTARVPLRGVTAVMGPSGCGKSTLVRVLNRPLELVPGGRVVSGVVRFRGEETYHRRVDVAALRKRIGIIHQRPVPFPMSVLENVLFGARYHGLAPRGDLPGYARRCLERVGLWDEVADRLRAPASSLSGGQQQRLCLARALANRPDALLLDEPCSALDPASTQRIEALMRDLSADLPVVVVPHNVAQARRGADHGLLLGDGRMVVEGPAAEVFAAPRDETARAFLSGAIG